MGKDIFRGMELDDSRKPGELPKSKKVGYGLTAAAIPALIAGYFFFNPSGEENRVNATPIVDRSISNQEASENYFASVDVTSLKEKTQTEKNTQEESDEKSRQERILEEWAQTDNTFNFYKLGDSEPRKTFTLSTIDWDEEGTLGERFERTLEDKLQGKQGSLIVERLDPQFEVLDGIESRYKGTNIPRDISTLIDKHYRNAEEQTGRITFIPKIEEVYIKTQDLEKTLDVEKTPEFTKIDTIDPRIIEEDKIQYDMLTMFNDPRNQTPHTYLLKENEEGNFDALRVLRIDSNNDIHYSRNDEDNIYDMTDAEISSLTYNVFASPKVNELTGPTRDSVYLKSNETIDKNFHDVLVEGANNLEGRLCSNNQSDRCISNEDLANAIGVSGVYNYAGEKAAEDLQYGVKSHALSPLKEINAFESEGANRASSLGLSIVLPGDDYLAQHITHYTGNVLEGEMRSDFRDLRQDCMSLDSAKGIAECMDEGTKSIISTIKYNGGNNNE